MGTNPVWYQNQNYLYRCTIHHINFGPECKSRASVAPSSFQPLIQGYWPFRQNPILSQWFGGSKNFLLWINIVQDSTDSQEKEFSGLKFFSCQNSQKSVKIWRKINVKKVCVETCMTATKKNTRLKNMEASLKLGGLP